MISTLHSINKLRQKLLIAIFLGGMFALPYLLSLMPVTYATAGWVYFIFALWLVLFSAVSYFLIFKTSILRKSGYSLRTRVLWFLAFKIIGLWFAFAIPLTVTENFSRTANLEIIATGQKHPQAQGSEVWVEGLFYSPGEPVSENDYHFGLGWELRKGVPVSYQNQPATLSWSGKIDQDMILVLTSHPWSGEAEIIWNGEKQVVDLYDPEGKSREIVLDLYAGISTEVLQQRGVLWQVSTGASIGLALFVLSAWLLSRKGFAEPQIAKNFPQILFLLGVLSLYLVTAAWLFPDGVNKHFFTRFALFLVPVAIFLCVAFSLYGVIKKEKPPISIENNGRLTASDFLLLLFPLAPVAQYILNNLEILSSLEAILLFCLFAVIVSIPTIAVPFLVRRVVNVHAMMSLGLAYAFSIINMALLSKQFSWHEMGATLVQLAVFGFVWAVFWLLYHFNMRSFAYIAVALFFVVNTAVQLTGSRDTHSTAETGEAENMLVQLVGDRKPAKTPNIYLLVYDAYVPNETMLAYGIDNSQQEKYLEENGFKLYPHTYTLAGTSIASMSRVLNASTSFYGDTRRATSGDGVVQNLLKKFGYQTYGVFPSGYYFLGNPSTYDYSYPGYANSIKYLIDGILIGEFKFDIGYEDVTLDKLNRVKYDVFSEDHNHPIFLYTHLHLPDHSQNSGICLPDETDLYNERLEKANSVMRNDIELLIEKDPNAIIIVAGDHGPYLTKTCYITEGKYSISEITRIDLQDRYGAFLAIRWPSSQFEDYDEIVVLQDIFPAVFAYLFDDPGILKSKIESKTFDSQIVSGASILNGIIEGGINDGEPLFIGQPER